MPFDGLVLAAVTEELAEKLTGGRIERVYQPVKDEIILVIHRPNLRCRLLLSAGALHPRIHMTTAVAENPTSPPPFCMLLRKYLEGGRISSFVQPDLERVLIIDIDSRDELGSPAPKQLILEIMGKHSNIILTDPTNGTITDGIKRYSHAVSRYREVLPGRLYIPPPQQNKTNSMETGEEEFRAAFLRASLDSTLPQIIQQCFSGMSLTTSREIVFRANLPFDMILDQCGEYELRSLWLAFRDCFANAAEGDFAPCLTIDNKGSLVDFAALDLTHSELRRQTGEMNSLLNLFYNNLVERRKIQQERNKILKTVNKETNKQKKKLNIFDKSISDAAKATDLQLFGELLTANIYQLEKGLNEATLENYQDGAKLITIPLDPRKTPVENAQHYFKQYNKAKNTKIALASQIKQAQEIRDYLEGVISDLEQSNDLSSLNEINQELMEQGFVKMPLSIKKTAKKSKLKQKPQLLEALSSDGMQIFVGKNNMQNDYLTLKIAQEHDIWLHTKDIHGAHVIIRTEGRETSQSTLLEAANLAAYFSKGRISGNVPVDYTKRKHVSKPNGARPGMVIYTHQKTIVSTPDETLVERLLKPNINHN